MNWGCSCNSRCFSAKTRRCETCGCAYVACGISASPQGIRCAREILHEGDHVTQDGHVIRTRTKK